MYPSQFFGLFPPFPRKPRAFVAMSFATEFDQAWHKVLKPGLELLEHGGQQVSAFRVDLSVASDAILTEILEAISDSLVIVADITALGTVGGRPVRNANVMYELGLAHAVRQPEEVVVFRSDQEELDFDVQGVRVHSYDPSSHPEEAREHIANTVVESLAALEARRSAAVRWATKQLTDPALMILAQAMDGSAIAHAPAKTMGQVLGGSVRREAIALLLRLGALSSKVLKVTEELLRDPEKMDAAGPLLSYEITPLGRAIFAQVIEGMGLASKEVVSKMEALLRSVED